ncbi:MAG: RNA-binding S4 domain-containing protein [Bacteroidia bacterium]|nr:RNA-binding S4 domain-containing protein [Bacteroidia bacterium]MBT8269474.1 RNA-binding S4 domain-containing protein [Bacteroidia bacterium]NNF81366.1 RNA-binding S4 domain-containing protein [Flavobacteriaceae bacterium]NNK70394.1 RNA-binding S4 domain-containing protein [Flavobacteriaceae bacterium]NNL79865.1 RNA-binding S4 domain-containing protein [Flavobacteriaceae bacterium]
MRIDKYLWCVRFFKTRSLASNACKKGLVKVNGQAIKPSRDIYTGDKIEVRRNQVNYSMLVLDIPPSRVGAKLVDIYRKDTTPSKEFKLMDMLRAQKEAHRKKGTGRPTKKERRDMDEYYDQNE